MTWGPELIDVATEYLEPMRERRCRHARPRLHALPAADGRHLLRDGRGRHPGVQRRGDGEGRVPDAGRPRPPAPCRPPRAGAPVHGHGRPASSSSGSAVASSAPRSAASRWSHEADRRRLPAAYPRATSAASCYLLEHDGDRIVLDLGNGSLGALQRRRRPRSTTRSTPSCSATATSTTAPTSASLYVLRHYQPTTRFAMLPVLGPVGGARADWRRSTGWPTPSRSRRSFDLRAFDAGADHDRALHDPRGPGRAPRRDVRDPRRRRGPVADVLRGHWSHAGAGRTGPGLPTSPCSRRRSSATEDPPDLHMTGADAARAAADAGAGLLVLTHRWPGTPTTRCSLRRRPSSPVRSSIARPGLTISV